MRNLAYLSYGAGLHEQEIAFSLLSALRFLGRRRADWRLVVYTDRPESFSGLGVATVPLDERTLADWTGPAAFGHRRKLEALRDALHRFDGPTALLDGDTYFRRSPARLFGRIGPGRSVMHLREGALDALPGGLHAALTAAVRGTDGFQDLAGAGVPIGASEPMWNSGVIGVDPADRRLLDEAIHLTDQLCERLRIHTLEQFSLGLVLGRHTQLRETDDLVFHYWDGGYRGAFRDRLPALLADTTSLPVEERARRCYAKRPRPTVRRQARVIANRVLRRLGLLPSVVRSSAN